MKIVFDTGIREYDVNGEILRFNPTDPNLYARFRDALVKIKAIEEECTEKAETECRDKDREEIGAFSLQMMQEADTKVKGILSETFGRGNDFNKIFGGVNIIARQENGTVLDAFLAAILPIMKAGIAELFDKDNAMVEKYAADYK